MKKTIALIVVLYAVLATGCASLTNAGITHFKLEPYTNAQGEEVCCVGEFRSGKEYAKIQGKISKNLDGEFSAEFEALGVKAFQGQQIAADVARSTTSAIKAILPDMVREAIRGVTGSKAIDSVGDIFAPGGAISQ